MNWLNRLFGRPQLAMVWHEAQIDFVGEQLGRVEDEMKSHWASVLTGKPGVKRAYLAIVRYGNKSTYQPALCVRHPLGRDAALVDALSEPFIRTFATGQALDIIFLNDEQEARLRRVCRPFFEAAA
jgi:hypothetical protein